MQNRRQHFELFDTGILDTTQHNIAYTYVETKHFLWREYPAVVGYTRMPYLMCQVLLCPRHRRDSRRPLIINGGVQGVLLSFLEGRIHFQTLHICSEIYQTAAAYRRPSSIVKFAPWRVVLGETELAGATRYFRRSRHAWWVDGSRLQKHPA